MAAQYKIMYATAGVDVYTLTTTASGATRLSSEQELVCSQGASPTLHAGRQPQPTIRAEGVTVKEVCPYYLTFQSRTTNRGRHCPTMAIDLGASPLPPRLPTPASRQQGTESFAAVGFRTYSYYGNIAEGPSGAVWQAAVAGTG